ncbi:transporter substrate-binding domain-containing protein [Streptomyces beigongshangae]|uniref:transporter substrate-binding domain-containing protein n=1 Tax=Streptomyces beigongshangae TaxID=2841597 RepID=UPI001C85F50C|nr:transporter substrate-binding domain-containing protein [Streptomyces sp. REN17]
MSYGAKFEQPGFNEYDVRNHRGQGFENDLAQYLEGELGITLLPHDIPSKDRESYLQERTDALVIATYSITDERRKKVDFAGPYFVTPQGLLVRQDDHSIKERKDTADKQICTASGSTSTPGAKNPLDENARFVTAQDYRKCVDKLLDGNVDAVWTDKVILYGFVQRLPGKVRVVDDIEVGSEQLYGVGLPLHQPERCHRVVEALRGFLRDKWRAFFQAHFEELVKSDPFFETHYKPNPDDLDEASCRST